MINYPTLEEVEKANHIQICRWWRFLPSPGSRALGKNYEIFYECLKQEEEILNKISEKLESFGGFTPEISKLIAFQ